MLVTELSVFISKFSFLIKDRKQSQNISTFSFCFRFLYTFSKSESSCSF